MAVIDRPAAHESDHRLDGSRPDCWRYLVEVQAAGLPAEPTGYR